MRTRISELGIPHWIQQVSVAEDRGQIRADATWWMMQHFTRHLLSGLPIDAILDKTYTAAWETAPHGPVRLCMSVFWTACPDTPR